MFESVRLIAASPKRNCPIVRGAPGLIGSVVPEAPASRLPSATVLFRLCFGPQHGASSCFVPFANESSWEPGALSWPVTRCRAVEVQTPLPFTALHQSVPVLLTRFPSVLSNVLPVRFPLEEATKKTENATAVNASSR